MGGNRLLKAPAAGTFWKFLKYLGVGDEGVEDCGFSEKKN